MWYFLVDFAFRRELPSSTPSCQTISTFVFLLTALCWGMSYVHHRLTSSRLFNLVLSVQSFRFLHCSLRQWPSFIGNHCCSPLSCSPWKFLRLFAGVCHWFPGWEPKARDLSSMHQNTSLSLESSVEMTVLSNPSPYSSNWSSTSDASLFSRWRWQIPVAWTLRQDCKV